MSQLTDKQIKARAYYAANAERIKAQKRAVYVNSPKATKKLAQIPTVPAVKSKPAKLVVNKTTVVVTPARREFSARERIENMRIERELLGDLCLI